MRDHVSDSTLHLPTLALTVTWPLLQAELRRIQHKKELLKAHYEQKLLVGMLWQTAQHVHTYVQCSGNTARLTQLFFAKMTVARNSGFTLPLVASTQVLLKEMYFFYTPDSRNNSSSRTCTKPIDRCTLALARALHTPS